MAKKSQIEVTEEEVKRRRKKVNSVRRIAENIHKLRRQITTDLKSDNEKTNLTALVVSIMDKTAERVGNESSADSGHYGVTGFRVKHVSVEGNKVRLNYVGKSGVEQIKEFTDSNMANMLVKCMERAENSEFPVFTTSDGFKIKADRINRYLSKFGITAKDIRGYSANRFLVDSLKNAEISGDEKDRQKKFREVIKSVAERVGHQAATLRKHYLLPNLEDEYVKKGNVVSVKEAAVVTEGSISIIASRLVRAFVRQYKENSDGSVTFFSTKYWPKFLVIPQGKNKYEVVQFASKKKVMNAYKKLPISRLLRYLLALQIEIFHLDKFMAKVEEGDFERAYKGYVETYVGIALCKLASSGAGFKKLKSTGRKAYDFIVEKDFDVDKIGLFDFLVVKNKMELSFFEPLFGEIEATKSESIEEYNYKDWNILVDVKTKYDTASITKLLDKVESALRSKGMGKLAYGSVFVHPTLPGGDMADYDESKDSLRLRSKGLKGTSRQVYDVLHELAHRNWSKFASKQLKSMMIKKYRMSEFAEPTSRDLKLNIGDVIIDKSAGDKYEVLECGYVDVIVELIETTKRRQRSIGKKYKIFTKTIATDSLTIEGKKKPDLDYSSYFPTSYSQTDYEEMYAELFSVWATKGLNDPARSWFEDLH